MRKPLRALLVSTAEAAARRVAEELSRGGYELAIVRVADGAAFHAQVSAGHGPWDVVLVDDAGPVSPLDARTHLMGTSSDAALVAVHFGTDITLAGMVAGAGASFLVAAIEQAMTDASLRRDHRELRERLIVTERLTSVGFLVAGVAHEVNNPLSAVIANQAYVRAELTRLAQGGHDLGDALAALEDAALATSLIRQVVRDLRTFGQLESGEQVEVLDPRVVFESALRMAWYEIRERAVLTRALGAAPLVRVNVARLSQVFLNLLLNAVQAIPPGNPTAHEIRAVTRTDEHGNLVAEVHDTGGGIGAETLPHIFDPFFTTKPPGSGTGIGLAVCHRLVERFGGKILVTSAVGVGSCFSVVLPPAVDKEP
jgi:signal transduction histidine kinase